MNIKTKSIILVIAFSFTIPFAAFAQENVETQSNDVKNEDDKNIIANVRMQEAKIISQNGNKFKLSFILINDQGIQPSVQYSVSLVNKEDNSIVEEKVYSEVLSLGGEEIKREIEYQAPEFLTGEYSIWVFARNSRAMTLGLGMAGEVSLNGNGEFINVSDCVSMIKDDQMKNELYKGGYPINFGVDVSPSEELIAKCKITNNFKTAAAVIPQFKNYFRSVYGELLSTHKKDSISLNPGESKEISLIIPKASKPQAYDAVLSFLNNKGETISNYVAFHYVIQGFSGTIQNLSFDKDNYHGGEMADISFYLTGSADDFYNSRGAGTKLENVNLTISIIGKNGIQCSEKIEKQLQKAEINQKMSIPIIADCLSPEAFVEFKDNNGNLLDKISFQSVAGKSGQGNDSSAEKIGIKPSDSSKNSEKMKSILMIIAGLIPIVVLLNFIIKKIKKNNHSSSLGLFILFFLFSCFIFSSKASAVTFTIPRYSGEWANGIATVSLNKSTYLPGETIVVYGTASIAICYNGNVGGSWVYADQLDLSGGAFAVNRLVSGYGSQGGAAGGNSAGYTTFTAPSVPGTYYMRFHAVQFAFWGPHSYSYEYYTVINPCVDTSWTPNSSTQCTGTSFTQTSNCGNTRTATGTMPSLSGKCGSAVDKLWEIKPNSDLCSIGTASDPTSSENQWCWNCSGICGGNTAECCAQRDNNWKEIAP